MSVSIMASETPGVGAGELSAQPDEVARVVVPGLLTEGCVTVDARPGSLVPNGKGGAVGPQ